MTAPADTDVSERVSPAGGKRRRLVIALGGNALLRRDDDGGIDTQFSRADASMRYIADLVAAGNEVVLTHGNGPVVGNILVRNEMARDRITPMPLYIAGADSEGGIGYMLQQSLYNQLRALGKERPVATVITQCVVDADDPALVNPSKPIGPYYTAEQAADLERTEGWTFADKIGRGLQRVVPSPRPRRIVEAPVVRRLAEGGDVVIAAGGGGIPVIEREDGTLEGIDAVIDKDWASALLANDIRADVLVILMAEDRVYLDYGTPQQRGLDTLTAEDADRLLAEGALETGSIAPKVAACAAFARATGRTAIICAVESLADALEGRTGTRVTAR